MPRKAMQPSLPTEMHSKRQPPTPEQIRAEQTRQAESDRAAPKATLPAVMPKGEVTATPALHSVDEYLNRNPGRMCVGRPIRPNLKLGRWTYADDSTDAPLPDDATYAVLYDLAWAGWTRLEANQPPQYDGAWLFQKDYRRHSRDELGDHDPTQWPLSQFDNQPTDPWKEAVYLPLEMMPSGEHVTIQIQSKPRSAAIFAVDGLLSHCRQLLRRDPDSFPVVKLAIGNYESKQYGPQFKPLFKIVGKVPKTGTKPPDSSLAGDLNDAIPFS